MLIALNILRGRLVGNWNVFNRAIHKLDVQKFHSSHNKFLYGSNQDVCTKRLERLNSPKDNSAIREQDRYPFRKMERGDMSSCLTFLTNVKESLQGSDYEHFHIASADLALAMRLQSWVEKQTEHPLSELIIELDETFENYKNTMPKHFSAQENANLFLTQITTVENHLIAEKILPGVMELMEKYDLISMHVIAMCSQKIQERYDSHTFPQWFEKYADALYEKMRGIEISHMPTVLAAACYSTLVKRTRWKELLEDDYLLKIVPVKDTFHDGIVTLYTKIAKFDESKLPMYLQRHIKIVSKSCIHGEDKIRSAMRFFYGKLLAAIAGNMKQRETLHRLLEIIYNECSYPLELNLQEAFTLRDEWNRLSPSAENKTEEKGKANVTMIYPANCECKNCGIQLEQENISDEDIETLIDVLFYKGLHESKLEKIWKVATPKEFKLIKDYMNFQQPYDLVIDYLNVMSAAKHQRFPFEEFSEFISRFSRVLCVTRRHSKHRIHPMFKHCDFFYTENQSSDDVFLIYAALKSGKHCKFMTGDDFSDHTMLLSNEDHVDLFSKWIRLMKIKQQYLVHFSNNQVHNTKIGIQKQQSGWHLSARTVHVTERSFRSSKTAPWLCLLH